MTGVQTCALPICCIGLTSITIPSSVTSIDSAAFYRCSGLKYVAIPGHISFKDNFDTTSNIDTVVIADGATTIPSSSFSECSKIKYISIPNSVTSIGQRAFEGCSGLTSITLPNGITKIENGTFKNCTSLTSVNLPSGLDSIGRNNYYFVNGAFEGCTCREIGRASCRERV